MKNTGITLKFKLENEKAEELKREEVKQAIIQLKPEIDADIQNLNNQETIVVPEQDSKMDDDINPNLL